MNPQFSQPGGSVSKDVNKQSIARVFGVKMSEVAYLKVGLIVDGYKILYDKLTQTCWYRGTAIGSVTSWLISGGALNLVTSAGTTTLILARSGDTVREDLSDPSSGKGGEMVVIPKGRAKEIPARSVTDMMLDGTAGLRKNFGAKGNGSAIDTQAINDMWESAYDALYKRFGPLPDEAAISFMLQKGPLSIIENGVYIYDGPGLDLPTGASFILNVRGESALSTKILIESDSYLFDLTNNPIYSNLSDLTIHGGRGAVRMKSTARTTAGIHMFKNLRLSRFSECGIGNNSIDMPYFRVRDCIFYGDLESQPIGVCVSGLSAGGYIRDNIFSDFRYGIKLAVGRQGTDVVNGPATPYNIEGNDFYRTGNRGGIDPDTQEFVQYASYDVWIEPGATATNSGRAIRFAGNKFGQEFLVSPDSHVLIADSATTGATDSLNGDKAHVETLSSGFISGLLFEGNNVNSANGAYIAPFIRSFTPNLGNTHISDLYDNDMPSRIIEFSPLVTQSQIVNISRTNIFEPKSCLALQKGVEPKLLSNLNDVLKVVDPNCWFAGHPQVPTPLVGSQMTNFVSLYAGPTSGITVAAATKSSVNNSYGGVFEASEITLDSGGRAFAVISGGLEGQQHYIDFELKRGSSNPVQSVKVEILSPDTNTIYMRRIVLLDSIPRWQRVILPFVPSVTGQFIVRFTSATFVSGTATNFILGNLNVYINNNPINTGHNGGLGGTWSVQHTVKGTRHEWYDASGNLRSKVGAPTSANDGVIISANPVL